MNAVDDVANLPVSQLHEPWVMLRPVRKDSVEYLLLRDSIQDRGLINSLSVRPSSRQPGKFEVIDGTYRYNCAVDLGRETLPCIIKHGVTDDDVLAIQIEANAEWVATKPIEFSRQLKRIYESQAGMSFAELARIVKQSSRWVMDRLGLLNLDDDVQQMVARGEIPLCNAYMLSRIAPKLRADYVDLARTMTVTEFKPLVANVIKRFKEAVHQGRMDERYINQVEPHAHLRSLKKIKQELESPTEGPLVLAAEGCKTPIDAWNAALRWVLHLDQRSLDEHRATHAKRKRTFRRKESEAHDETLG